MGKGARLRKQRMANRETVKDLLQIPDVKKAMYKEVGQQLKKPHEWFYENELYCMLYTLHMEFGFGETRLKRFCDRYSEDWKALRDYYEGGDLDAPYFAKQALLKAGIDVSKWERSD